MPNMLDSTPLKWMPWWNAPIHLKEFIKWTNDDHIKAILEKDQLAFALLSAHMQELNQNMPQAPSEPPKVNFSFAEDAMQDPEVRSYFEKTTGTPPSAPPPKPAAKPDGKGVAGAARAMKNSNDNSAPAGNKPQKPQGQGA
jgi:hypothetical protein